MFKTIFEGTVVTDTQTIICMVVALMLGFLISGAYLLGNKKENNSPHFAFTLVLLPMIVTIVIMLVGSDIAKAISLGGVFALVRFRSVPGDSKDITNVFFAMATGLACGMGYIVLAIVFTVFVSLVYIILVKTNYGVIKSNKKVLKITIPEDLSYQDVFADVFVEYTKGAEIVKVKTTNLGTLYELTYDVALKDNVNEKEFIDAIRCRNGNLNISLSMVEKTSEML